jgi:hypothetical protein
MDLRICQYLEQDSKNQDRDKDDNKDKRQGMKKTRSRNCVELWGVEVAERRTKTRTKTKAIPRAGQPKPNPRSKHEK